MSNKNSTKEEQYYTNFYNTGDYQIRKIQDMVEEEKFLDKSLRNYNAKRHKKCLEVGSGGGGYRI